MYVSHEEDYGSILSWVLYQLLSCTYNHASMTAAAAFGLFWWRAARYYCEVK